MKLLAFTDIHGSIRAIKKVADKAKKEKPSLMVCAGDVSMFEHGLDYLMHKINESGIPTLIVHGNHETETRLKKACSLFKNTIYLHNNSFEKNGCLFIGYGGGGFSIVDKKFEKVMRKFNDKIKRAKKVILIVHQPPYKTKLDRVMEMHCGNKSFSKFIKEKKPDLVICGHLHENEGKEDKIGKTRIVNPGPYGKILMV